MTSLLKKPAELLDRLSSVCPDFEFLPHARRKISQNQQPLHRSEFVSSRATKVRARAAQYAYYKAFRDQTEQDAMAMGNGMMLIARAASLLEAFAPTHISFFFVEKGRYHKIQKFEMTRSSRHFLGFCTLNASNKFPKLFKRYIQKYVADTKFRYFQRPWRRSLRSPIRRSRYVPESKIQHSTGAVYILVQSDSSTTGHGQEHKGVSSNY
jgi:hypothetical protein